MTRDLVAGDSVGDWRLCRPLGQGAFGTTWAARDPLGQEAALKFLGEPPGDELRALARLSHPAIPAVLDAAATPRPYLVMELAAGRPLQKMLRQGRAPEQPALQIIAVLADALAEVHAAGLHHGDLKPENVLVDRIGDLRIWLVDFGAAADASVGTLHYAAPERLQGAQADPISDVYSLGLMLYELLHGTLPGFDDSISAALLARRTERPEVPRGQPWVKSLVGSMLEPNRTLRPTAAVVADTLEAHGLRLPQPDGSLIRRRARAVRVAPPGFDTFLADALAEPGASVVVGATGTGRSDALRAAATELQASGATWLRWTPSEVPGQSVVDALSDARLPGEVAAVPTEPDAGLRARLTAEALVNRAGGMLHVLADDIDQCTEDAQGVLAALAERSDAYVVAASTEPVAWASRSFMLCSMDDDAQATLVTGILSDPAPVAELVERLAPLGGRPGQIIEAIAQACDTGELRRQARRWSVYGPGFSDLVERLASADSEALPTDSDAAVLVGALLAAARGPLVRDRVREVAGLDEDAFAVGIRELIGRGYVVTDGDTLSVSGPRVARGLEAAHPTPSAVHRRLVDHSEDLNFGPLRVLHHLVQAADCAYTARLGPAAIRGGVAQDPEQTATLALALWEVAPHAAVAGSVLEALLAGGRSNEAAGIGEELLRQDDVSRDVLVAMARHRIHVASEPGAALPLLAQAASHVTEGRGVDLAFLRAHALFLQGEHDACVAVAEAACKRRPGARLDEQDAWVMLHSTWAQAAHELGRTDEAIRIIESVPSDVASGRPCHASIQGTLGRMMYYAGRIRDAAVAMERASLDPQLPTLQRAQHLNNAAVASYQCGDRRSALARWERALALFERLRATLDEVRVCNNLCVGYTEAGRWARALAAGESAYGRASERDGSDAVVYAAMSAGNLGDLFAAQGDYETAKTWYMRAQRLADQHKIESEQVELARRLAEVAILTGAADAPLRARHAVRLARKAGDEIEGTRSEMLALVCRADTRPPREMHARIESIVEFFRKKGLGGHIAHARAWAADALLRTGDGAGALKLADAVAMYAVENGHVPLRRRAEHLREQARSLSRADPRRDRFERMLALATRVAREQDSEAVLDAIARAGLELLDGDRCFVLLLDGDEPRVVRSVGRSGIIDPKEARPSHSIVNQVLAQNRPVIANDIMERGDLREARSVALMALRSALCVPMSDGDELLGLIYVDSQRSSEEELSDATHLMRALSSHAAVAISHARHMASLERRAVQAAELVHDLRSPVSVAASILDELTEQAADDPDMVVDVEVVREAREALNQALALAERVLRGDVSQANEPFDLGRRVAAAARSVGRTATAAGCEVTCEVEDGLVLVGDHNELVRVVTNLLSNAVRYSPEGGTVYVSARAVEDRAEVVVYDEGPGIPSHLLGPLFDRGVKDAGERGGHGLGLAIVQRLMRDLGGTVRADNHPEAGARFTLSLPLQEGSRRAAG